MTPAAAAVNDTEALAKATQNPVASLISVPLQNNSNFNVGPYNRTQDIFNIQPVIPKRISENWMLITRVIQPILWQPYTTETTGGQVGIGDLNPTFFLSPAKPGKLIWGFGPAIVLPTATSTLVGQGKLSFGHWTFGALVNNVFSVAGSSHRPSVNQMTPQYFITYNLKKGWNINSRPIIAANWHNKASGDAANGDDTDAGGRWTIPYGGGVGRVTRMGFQPVNFSIISMATPCILRVHHPGACGFKSRCSVRKSQRARPVRRTVVRRGRFAYLSLDFFL
jgi:hypothetical protein